MPLQAPRAPCADLSALLLREARGTGPRLAGVTSSSLWVGSPATVERRADERQASRGLGLADLRIAARLRAPAPFLISTERTGP